MNDNSIPQLEVLQQKLHAAEEENKKLRKELEHIHNSARTQINLTGVSSKRDRSISNISKIVHDIKNPLNNIKLSADLINKTIDNASSLENENLSRCQTWLKIITDSCNKAFVFLQNISIIEEIESDNFVLQKETSSLSSFIQNLIPDILPLAREKEISLNFIPPSEESYVAVDKKYFGKALSNILANAIKYTHPKGLVNVTTKREGELVFIEISDNGIGIPEENFEAVFNKFTKVVKQGTAGEPSKGIGLYTAKRIVNLHNGQLWVKNGHESGSVFYIALKPLEINQNT